MRVDASQVLAQGGVKIKNSEEPDKQGAGALNKRGREAAAGRGADAGAKQSAEAAARQGAEAAAKQGQAVLTRQGAEALAKQGTEALIETLKEGVLIGDEEEAEETEDASKEGDAREKDAAGGKGAAREGSAAREGGAIRERGDVRESGAVRDRVDVRERDAAREGGAIRERGDVRESGAVRERADIRESGAARERGDVRESGAAREQSAAGAEGAARGKGDVVAESAVGGRRTVVSEGDITLAKPNATDGFSDKSLEPYAAKLAELKMPVTEDSARAMRDLMAQYPRLSMDEAAFLATNKIVGDESLMRAALGVLSGGDKTSAMISQIISTLAGEVSGEQNFLVNLDLGTRDPKNSIGNSNFSNNFNVGGSNHAPLTELIAAIVKNAPGLLASAGTAQSEILQGNPASANSPQQIITQLDSNMQLNEEKIIDFLQDPGNEQNSGQGSAQAGGAVGGAAGGAQTAPGAVPGGGTAGMPGMPGQEGAAAGVPGALAGDGPVTAEGAQGAGQPAVLGAGTGTAQVAAETAAGAAEQQAATDEAKGGAAQAGEGGRSAPGAMAQLLSELPEFKGTPQAALDRFSNMLLRIAEDTGITKNGGAVAEDVKMLASQFEKLFTRIGRQDADAGARLREAREELFARLTLVQEEIARASQPMKAELLAQTQKLMDHVRLLNNIDQFVYMQLPVKLGEEEKTAELYVFKRKGGKRADSDNVNILLSIDLQFMGHWEAMLNIKGRNVYLNMEVAGEAEKEHFSQNTVLLHQLLAEEGFKLVNTSIKISQEETTPLTAMSALDRYTGARQGKIDFVI